MPMPPRTRAVRSDGARSRAAILDHAMALASVTGLDGLSIGDLAAATGMSKGGVYAHFGSKEDLQLAVIRAARTVFIERIVAPALQQDSPAGQLRALAEGFLDYVQDRVFPGGCFFVSAAAEFGSRPGPVREEVAAAQRDWAGLLQAIAARARHNGELPAHTDPDQLAFQLASLLAGANLTYVLHDEPALLDRARQAVRTLLADPGPDTA
jgi:AcrR family transcriptional regulator